MNHEFWYLSRASGFVAYLLLFVSVALGIAIGTRFMERIARRNAVFDLHRFTTLLALAFTLFHVYILLGDGFFNFNVWQLSIPGLSPYSPWSTAAGIVSLYAIALIIASFYLRRFIGYRAWRGLHFLTFAAYGAVTLHSIAAGTDSGEPWARAIYLSTGAAVLVLIIYRIQHKMPDAPWVRTARLASAIGAVIAAVVLLALGFGLQRSSSQASVEEQSAAEVPSPATLSGSSSAHPILASFNDVLRASISRTGDATSLHLIIDGQTSGDVPFKLHAEVAQMSVQPTPDIEAGEHDPNDDETAEARLINVVTANKAQLVDLGTNTVVCDGTLTALSADELKATCQGAGAYEGVRMSLSSRIRSSQDGTVSGPLSGTMVRTG